MPSTLLDFLNLILADSDNQLVSEASRTLLGNVAANLPCVPRALLECRLAPGNDQVDLSQSFLHDDLASLRTFLDEYSPQGPGWPGIIRFLEAWSEPDGLVSRSVASIWLEFDVYSRGVSESPAPAVFLSLKLDGSTADSKRQAEHTLQYIAGLLGVEGVADMTRQLVRCIDLLPEEVAPSYVGLMLSRSPLTMRAQFSGFSKRQLQPYLAALGLDASVSSYTAAMELAFGAFENCVLCLDLAPEAGPRIGFELFPSQYLQGVDAETFLDMLVDGGYCEKEKRAAALGWPQRWGPSGRAGSWPDKLVLESLLRPPDQFGVVDKQINHFKLVCGTGNQLEAKVYLGADQLWVTLRDSESASPG